MNNDLRTRRESALAPSYQLFYDDPVHLVRGEDVWVTTLGPGTHLGGVMTAAAYHAGRIVVTQNNWPSGVDPDNVFFRTRRINFKLNIDVIRCQNYGIEFAVGDSKSGSGCA